MLFHPAMPLPLPFVPPSRDQLFSACFRRVYRFGRRWDEALWRFHELSAVLRLLAERPALRDGPILDVGCGDGEVFRWLFGARTDADGIDSGAARQSDLGLANQAACYREVRQEDAAGLSAPDDHYGLVFANSVLEHIAPIAPVLEEAARVLRPGGHLLFTTPDPLLYSAEVYAWRAWLRPLGLDFVGQAIARKECTIYHHVSVLAEADWRRRLEQAGLTSVERIGYLPVEVARPLSSFSGASRVPRLQRLVEKLAPLAREIERASDADEEAWIACCRRVLAPLLDAQPTAQGCGQLLLAQKPGPTQVAVGAPASRRRFDKPLRVLWLCKHRIARYEEVGALLRTGAEVIPVAGEMADFPNAVQLNEEDDPLYPRWRASCSVPAAAVQTLREYDYFKHPEAPDPQIAELLDRYIDVVWVASWSSVAVGLLQAFRGGVVLRSYGRYPYAQVLGPWPQRERALQKLASSDRYVFCPALPYQGLVDDPRLTRGQVYWQACVTTDRLGHRWAGRTSERFVCETISLIERYRKQMYEQYLANFGTLPLRIFGQNPVGGVNGDDPRIVGTLPDDAYNQAIAACRVMLYAGLGNKYHLHYHAIEALMMGVPLLFFESSAVAHIALYLGWSRRELHDAGMCASADEARTRASRLLDSVDAACELSAGQEGLRALFRPEASDGVLDGLLTQLGRDLRYRERYADAGDAPPRSLDELRTSAAASAHRALNAVRGLFGKS